MSVEIDTAAVEKRVLSGLKDFQRRTVDYVFKRLYTDRDSVRRFLVADEVGLGKTLVARGVIAKAIRHLEAEGIKRIDIVYVCSNADIAQQNIRRLNVTEQADFSLASRITLLPLQLRELNTRGLNFVSFTPGTSFDFGNRSGQAGERALLFRLLEHCWGRKRMNRQGVYRLLQGGVQHVDRFRWMVHNTPSRIGVGERMIDPTLAESFAEQLAKADRESAIQDRFFELADAHTRKSPGMHWHARQDIVAELRRHLARTCVRALEPDLVILDEFQRFRHLLEDPDPDNPDDVRALAHHLFNQPDARVLMLSATPYKMYSLSDESDDDHYQDFVRTARFLMGDEVASQKLATDLRHFRNGLFSSESGVPDQLLTVKRRIEKQLRKVMTRTERLSVTPDRSGMLKQADVRELTLAPTDIHAYVAADRVSRHLDAGDPLEYWKSAPYLFNFMESYKVKRQLKGRLADGDAESLAALVTELAGAGILSMEAIRRYRRIDPGNAKLRALLADTIERGTWRLLWMPPALPYYEPGPPFDDAALEGFSKRLVFSSWTVAPQAIASILSYDAERRMMHETWPNRRNTQKARKQIRGLLRFARDSRDGERLTGMPIFALLYPSPALARLGDPLAIWSESGSQAPMSQDRLLAAVRERIGARLAGTLRRHRGEGPPDETWYWLAPLLLDRGYNVALVDEWLRSAISTQAWRGPDGGDGDDSAWGEHLELAANAAIQEPALGVPPEDLLDVLALLAVAGPANTALRALSRVSGGTDALRNSAVRNAAAHTAWGLRTLFNIPEVMSVVRGVNPAERIYWRSILQYALNGNLQAVLDEYLHVLPEWLGLVGRPPEESLGILSKELYDVVALRAANYGADDIRVDGSSVSMEPVKFRARYALRFGVRSADEEQEVHRAGFVRAAFNSPFWPFVLASTSLGQEGLDFHQYCHAVVHWNLPANPVDMEQREGRVHRFKGHAVRKNLARAHGSAAQKSKGKDPWQPLFEAGRPERNRGSDRDLVPYWVFTTDGGAFIERYVPALPLSRDAEKYEQLKRSLAAYRLVFGQPRQEDMVAYLNDRLDRDQLAALLDELRIDLSPR